jgi:propanol-preferring alcohol dehydrogenase
VAPILCAGVTVYKGLKVTDTQPGDWVVISDIGGLGHLAVQHAKSMGRNDIAVDVDDGKLRLAERLGASLTVNARNTDPAASSSENINSVFDRMRHGTTEGRIVLDFKDASGA